MVIALVASIQFSNEMIHIKKELEVLGHTVLLPYSTEKIASGHLSLDAYMKEKEAHGDLKFRNEGPDLIKDHYEKILSSNAILVLNYTKKGIEHYIGGNALMEMGFAYVNHKKIFLLNPIPDMPYKDELVAMNPTVVNKKLQSIR